MSRPAGRRRRRARFALGGVWPPVDAGGVAHTDVPPGSRRLAELIRKYDRPVPRYTSYPTAVEFHDGVGETAYREALARANARPDAPWSIYLHVPFCRTRCHFCACSVVVSPDQAKVSEPYVARLSREIESVCALVPDRRRVAQLHLGGGTPTYLRPDQLRDLYALLRARFEPQAGAEIAIEIDPRVTTGEHLDVLLAAGVNRVSMGVQDLDPAVQAAIGREQPAQSTVAHVRRLRAAGVRGINVDLIYGLPLQSEAGFALTLDAIVGMGIDRIALYSYAHMPWAQGNQRRVSEDALPDPGLKLQLFLSARERLLAAGYRAIGMDHFARDGDALEVADRRGELHRNFMGYTVMPGDDMLGFGVSSIGEVGGTFFQNHKKLAHYRAAVDAGRIPVARGFARTRDDGIRARVVADLMCRHRVDRIEIERAYGLPSFDAYFREDLELLAALEADGLVVDTGEGLEVTSMGRNFVRNVAMCFDARSRARARQGTRPRLHSRAV